MNMLHISNFPAEGQRYLNRCKSDLVLLAKMNDLNIKRETIQVQYNINVEEFYYLATFSKKRTILSSFYN